jgi:hypothetical protein
MRSLDDLIERRKSHVEYLDKLKSWNSALAIDPQSDHSLKSQSSTTTSGSRSAAGPPSPIGRRQWTDFKSTRELCLVVHRASQTGKGASWRLG